MTFEALAKKDLLELSFRWLLFDQWVSGEILVVDGDLSGCGPEIDHEAVGFVQLWFESHFGWLLCGDVVHFEWFACKNCKYFLLVGPETNEDWKFISS